MSHPISDTRGAPRAVCRKVVRFVRTSRVRKRRGAIQWTPQQGWRNESSRGRAEPVAEDDVNAVSVKGGSVELDTRSDEADRKSHTRHSDEAGGEGNYESTRLLYDDLASLACLRLSCKPRRNVVAAVHLRNARARSRQLSLMLQLPSI
jgi:hypothetical protein